MSDENIFLFSVDLEDVRDRLPNGIDSFRPRVVENTKAYLNFLDKLHMKCTFFTEGKTAERYPELIQEIFNKGHEIACHSYDHTELNHHTEKTFCIDIEKCLNVFNNCKVNTIRGYRAPVLSATKNTPWLWKSLQQFGFTYSSSVLPAKNPLHGYPEFGTSIKLIDDIVEIPVNVSRFLHLKIPFAGGIYFRFLPYFILKNNFNSHFKNQLPVVSYMHPYDVDTHQEKFMHPGINNSKIYNYLMYYNRAQVFDRLNNLFNNFNYHIIPYQQFVEQWKKN